MGTSHLSAQTKTMTKTFLIFSILFCALYSVAQDTTHVSSLDEVVITANKYARKQSETGKVLTVINREQLEKSGGRTLAEIVNTVSGTTIIGSNGNQGTNMTASIRGSTAGNVLILVNGIPVNDPSVITNYFDLNFFSVDQVERIEILKGGQSTLYGSDAVAGVINVITRKSSIPGMHPDVSVSAGSYGTIKTNIGFRQHSKQSLLSLDYGFETSKGFSSAFDSTGKGDYDKDKYNQHNVTGTWQYSITDKLLANIFGQYSWYKTGVDAGAFADQKDYNVTTDNIQGGAGLSYQIKNGAIQFNYRYNKIKRLYLDDSIYKQPFVDYQRINYEGITHFAELYGNKKWDHIELLAGLDYRKNLMSSASFFVPAFGPNPMILTDSLANMAQVSPYASVVLKSNNGLNIELGGRWNHHSLYGNNFSYTINPNILIDNKVKLFVNLYSAFKTPTLYQLFDAFSGNKYLKPEESFNAEFGAQWYVSKNFNARAVYFYRNTKDAIEYVITDPTFFTSQYRNVSRKKANGIELELAYNTARWNLSANYTHTHGRLKSKYDGTGMPVLKDTVIDNVYRIPNDVVNVSAGVNLTSKLYAGANVRVAAKRLEPVYGGAPVALASYYSADVYGEYKLCKSFKLFADFRNVTNQHYFEVLGYNTRGFNFTGGARVSL
ncbi:MAG: TonB-dependent receptor [Flavitalea sp.]